MKKIILTLSLLSLLAIGCKKQTNFIEITTDYGVVLIELYDETPLHRDNFKKLVAEGFYDDLLFHRVIGEFMIQGGDPESKEAKAGVTLGSGGPGYKVDAEFSKSERCYHKKGALAAAREGDYSNPERKSSGSQFYIVVGRPYAASEITAMERNKFNRARQNYFNLESIELTDSLQALYAAGKQEEAKEIQRKVLAKIDAKMEEERNLYYYTDDQRKTYTTDGGTPHLDGSYTVFGQVVKGIEVIENISKAETNAQDRPSKDIKMKMKFVKKP